MNRVRFETKKDWFGKILLFGPALIITTLAILHVSGLNFGRVISTPWPFIIGGLFFWLFAFLGWNFTYYVIDQNTLTARMALFRSTTVNIDDIKEIKAQEYGLRVFGLSKDVLSIKLKTGGELNISPKEPNELTSEVERRRAQRIMA
jgi:uncharacterized membrane protein YdbT with pleckstrin-like domain